MQVNWRTAKKYGDGNQLPQEKTHLKKDMMYDEEWGEIVIDWLEEDLTNQLEQQLINDRQRIHYKKEVLIDELWQQEQKQLIKLPEESYPVFKQFLIKFNKYNEFKLDGHLIHVPRVKELRSTFLCNLLGLV